MLEDNQTLAELVWLWTSGGHNMVNTMDNTTPSPLLESPTPKAYDTEVGVEQSKCYIYVYIHI